MKKLCIVRRISYTSFSEAERRADNSPEEAGEGTAAASPPVDGAEPFAAAKRRHPSPETAVRLMNCFVEGKNRLYQRNILDGD